MRLVRAARRAAPRRRAPKLARTIVVVLGLVAALPASSSARQHAVTTLGFWPAGQGRIEARLEGGDRLLGECGWNDVEEPGGSSRFESGNSCFVEVETRARVTLVAKGADGSPFMHWDRFECDGTSPCTVTADDPDDLVVATFKKQHLEVLREGNGVGSVTSSDGSINCPDTCEAWVDADTTLELTAAGSHAWGKGCEPAGGDPASPKCSVTMSNLRTFAQVGFPDVPVEIFPFDVRVKVRVQRRGSGTGRVYGQGKTAEADELRDWRIDCGSSCTAENLQIQTRLSLTADADPGSHFVRWLGVCSTNLVCPFVAGTQKVIGAVFERDAPPPPPPPPPAPPPPAPPPPAPPPPAPPPPPPPSPGKFQANVTKLAIVGRAVVLRVVLDRPAKATLRLVRGRTTLATRHYELAAGRTDLRFVLPRRLQVGWYRITGRFVSANGETSPLDRPFRLRR